MRSGDLGVISVDVVAMERVTVLNLTLLGSVIFAFLALVGDDSAERLLPTLTLTFSGGFVTNPGC